VRISVQEIKQLKPGERVLVIGASSEPYLCTKKDEKALMNFFQKHICFPFPDYASRKLIWPGLVERHGGIAPYDFDWATLAQITENYTSGQLDQVARSILTQRRLSRLKLPGSTHALQMFEYINWVGKLRPVAPEAEEGLKKFTDKTPARAALAAAAAGDLAKVPTKGGSKVKGKKGKK
jgi:IQ and AAA domain-containing protein